MKNQILIVGGLAGLGVGIAVLSSSLRGPAPADTNLEKTVTPTVQAASDFLGEKGELVAAQQEKVAIPVTQVNDNQIHYYHYFSESAGRVIYFFVLQAADGTYRAAANACEVCYGARRGFYQDGDQIVCQNCGQAYAKERIGLEKGGCNPAPISADLPVMDGKLYLTVADLDQLAYLF